MDQIAQLERRVVIVERDVEELKRSDAQILADIAQIKERQEQAATKADLAQTVGDIKTFFQEKHIDVLQRALNSVPTKQMAVWTIIMGVVMVVGLALQLHH